MYPHWSRYLPWVLADTSLGQLGEVWQSQLTTLETAALRLAVQDTRQQGWGWDREAQQPLQESAMETLSSDMVRHFVWSKKTTIFHWSGEFHTLSHLSTTEEKDGCQCTRYRRPVQVCRLLYTHLVKSQRPAIAGHNRCLMIDIQVFSQPFHSDPFSTSNQVQKL